MLHLNDDTAARRRCWERILAVPFTRDPYCRITAGRVAALL
jgi:hypothetical protein